MFTMLVMVKISNVLSLWFYQAKNILSFRSLKAYQEKPTDAQEKAIVKGLRDYPLDTIAR